MDSKDTHILDEQISDLSLFEAGLISDEFTALSSKGYNTIGHLYDLQVEGLAIALNIDFDKAETIWQAVLEVVSNPQRWKSSPTIKVQLNLSEILIPSIESYFLQTEKNRIYTILVRRLGLNGSAQYTLEDIGIYFDITRERVRQLEAKGFRLLKNYFFPLQKPLDSDERKLQQEVSAIKEHYENIGNPFLLEDDIFDFIEQRYSSSLTSNQKAFYRLLFTVFGWTYVESPAANLSAKLDSFWIVDNSYKASTIIKCVTTLTKSD